jgi:preprotein translocase subunit SecY
MFGEPAFVVLNTATRRRIPIVHKETMMGRSPNVPIRVDDTSVSS